MAKQRQGVWPIPEFNALVSRYFPSPVDGTSRVFYEYGGVSDRGRVNPHNEDHFAVIHRTRSQHAVLSNLPEGDLGLHSDEAYLLIVADGVGGNAFGELASRLAIRTLWEVASQAAHWIMRVSDIDLDDIRERVDAHVEVLQRFFRERALSQPATAQMGTTWTSAYVMGQDAIIAHIGDSRAYLCRNGRLRRVTRDHTLAQMLIETGLQAEKADRFQHVLVNCFGAHASETKAEVRCVHLDDGDSLLLCTDGLTRHLDDAQIEQHLCSPKTPQAICESLVGAAVEDGGTDNVTAVVVRINVPASEAAVDF
ncbi:Serine/threonine phosphatase stp [Maioricimonas rarisocia]|uniref:Serine/threonine phosphatase stp n=2 Tax=Maioricimonas rarisocia TaxID=2528026 RepID=A0A517Z4Y6_9PLAN|nr:Serine/threonine phosphatase stp [Maioricimonas rarisocia]